MGRGLTHPGATLLAWRWWPSSQRAQAVPTGTVRENTQLGSLQGNKKATKDLEVTQRPAVPQEHWTGGGVPRMSRPLPPPPLHPPRPGQQPPLLPQLWPLSEASISLCPAEFRQLSRVSLINEHPARRTPGELPPNSPMCKSHFRGEKTEAQKSEVIRPRSCSHLTASQSGSEPGLHPSCTCLRPALGEPG